MNRLVQRFLLACAGLVIAVLAFAAIFLWNAHRKLNAKVEDLRRAGKPVTIADLGDSVRFTGNADRLRDLEKSVQALERAIMQAPNTGNEQTDKEARIAIFRKFESTEPELIDQLRQAASAPLQGNHNLNFDARPQVFLEGLMEQAGLYRMAVRALSYHAEAVLADGNTDAALVDAMAILRWSEQISHEPGLVSHQVSLVVRESGIDLAANCLYRGDASAAAREELLEVVRQHDRIAAWSRMIDSERALGRSLYEEAAGPTKAFAAARGDGVGMLEAMEAYDALGAKPAGLVPGHIQTGPLSANLLPALAAVLSAHRRVQAKSQALQVLAAWQDAGSDPKATVESLGLPKLVTIDPFDGSLMKLKMTPSGPLIYAVGDDLTDNGGAIQQGTDPGIGPPLVDHVAQ